MRIALTGVTGFIGSHVLTELQAHGHEVTALVRNDAQAERVTADGATAAVVDLYDRPAVVRLLNDLDGAVHTASPGDATSADLDAAVVDAAVEAFAGTGKAYAHISGCGSTARIPRSPRSRRSLAEGPRCGPRRRLPTSAGERFGARLLRDR
jgi:uncharacterized protein YbjT (DUF2867 family)